MKDPDQSMFQATRLVIDKPLSFGEWEQIGNQLAVMHVASPWWIGDWYNAGAQQYGEKAASAECIADATETASYGRLAVATVQQYASICNRFPDDRRRPKLTFGHHRVVRALAPSAAAKLLSKAESESWTVARLRKELPKPPEDKAREPANANQLANAEPFQVIYADPPWQYSNTNVRGAARKHYETMPFDEICRYLRMTKIRAQDNAVLFLWVTNPMIAEGLQVCSEWGFAYKTKITWLKTDDEGKRVFGAGFYIRGVTEDLFIAVRGNKMLPAVRDYTSFVEAPRGKHSEKPDVFYEMIEAMYPKMSRVELFARKRRDGWHQIGDELK